MAEKLEVPEVDVDEFLAHYGVAGMKWGKRSSRSSTSSDPKPTRRERNHEILQARGRQAARERKFQEAQGDFMVSRGKGKAKAEKIMRQLEKDYFLGDDAKTASKMTSGEKWTTGVFAGLTVASVALSVASSR